MGETNVFKKITSLESSVSRDVYLFDYFHQGIFKDNECDTTSEVAPNILKGEACTHNDSEKLYMTESKAVNVVEKLTNLDKHREDEHSQGQDPHSFFLWGIGFQNGINAPCYTTKK